MDIKFVLLKKSCKFSASFDSTLLICRFQKTSKISLSILFKLVTRKVELHYEDKEKLHELQWNSEQIFLRLPKNQNDSISWTRLFFSRFAQFFRKHILFTCSFFGSFKPNNMFFSKVFHFSRSLQLQYATTQENFTLLV